jgi:hypothetical protein
MAPGPLAELAPHVSLREPNGSKGTLPIGSGSYACPGPCARFGSAGGRDAVGNARRSATSVAQTDRSASAAGRPAALAFLGLVRMREVDPGGIVD